MTIKQAFTAELKALLEKYNASISFDCTPCSDLHGVYDPAIAVLVVDPETGDMQKLLSVDGYSLDPTDL